MIHIGYADLFILNLVLDRTFLCIDLPSIRNTSGVNNILLTGILGFHIVINVRNTNVYGGYDSLDCREMQHKFLI